MLRLAVVLSVLACLPAASAAQSKSALSWVREPGAESCIGTVELGRRVERLVGPMLVPAPEGQVSVEGRIARAASGFIATVVIADASGALLGTRQLKSEPEDCRAIDDKLAFVIAVAIDPNAALAELPGELSQEDDPGAALLAELRAQPAQAAPPTATVAARPRRPVAKSIAHKTSTRVGLRAALEPALGLGNLPDPSAGATLGAGVAFGDLALWLRANGWLPQEQTVRGAARVGFVAFGLGLAVCPLTLRSARWSASLCPGVGADLIVARPVAFMGTTRHRWTFGPDLELRAGFEASAMWWLGLSAALQSRWPHQQIGYDTSGTNDSLQTVYRTPLASGRLAVVLELRF